MNPISIPDECPHHRHRQHRPQLQVGVGSGVGGGRGGENETTVWHSQAVGWHCLCLKEEEEARGGVLFLLCRHPVGDGAGSEEISLDEERHNENVIIVS